MHFGGLGGCLFSAICVLDAVDVVFVGGLSLLLVVLDIGLRGLGAFAFACGVFVC